MKLSEFDALRRAQEDGAQLVLLHPATNEPTDIVFTVVHAESERVRAKVHEIGNRALVNKTKVATTQEHETNLIEITAASIVDWQNLDDENGEPVKHSHAAAAKVLREHPWVMEQVANFAGSRANFFTK